MLLFQNAQGYASDAPLSSLAITFQKKRIMILAKQSAPKKSQNIPDYIAVCLNGISFNPSSYYSYNCEFLCYYDMSQLSPSHIISCIHHPVNYLLL